MSYAKMREFIKTHKVIFSILIISLVLLGIYFWLGAIVLKYAKIFIWIFLAAFSLFFLSKFVLQLFAKSEPSNDHDFKLLATFGTLALLTLFLPDLISRISEYQGIKFTQQQKKEALTKFGLTSKFLSMNDPSVEIEGNFEVPATVAQLFFEIQLSYYSNEDERNEKLQKNCQAINLLGFLSPKQIDFIIEHRVEPFAELTYLLYGLPSNKPKNIEDKDWEKILEKRKSLEDQKDEACGIKLDKNLPHIGKLGSKNEELPDANIEIVAKKNIPIETVAKKNIPIGERRGALSNLISTFEDEKDKLHYNPIYYNLMARLNTHLAKTYGPNFDEFQGILLKAEKYYSRGLALFSNNSSLQENYCIFLTFEKLNLKDSVGCFLDVWKYAEEELRIFNELYKVTPNEEDGLKDKMISLARRTLESRILESKNYAIYNAAILGDLDLLELKDVKPQDFIKQTFKKHQFDDSYLDTEAVAYLVMGLEEECPERGLTFQKAKEKIMTAREIAKKRYDKKLVLYYSAKLDFLNTVECKN